MTKYLSILSLILTMLFQKKNELLLAVLQLFSPKSQIKLDILNPPKNAINIHHRLLSYLHHGKPY